MTEHKPKIKKWLDWHAFNPYCPYGHDECDLINLNTIKVFCYICLEKYFEEDYL